MLLSDVLGLVSLFLGESAKVLLEKVWCDENAVDCASDQGYE